MMRHIKLFEAFSTPKPLSEEQINWLDECAGGSWNLNPSTGLIDMDGDFKYTGQGLKDFKGVAFGHVKGDFYCGYNQLTSLVGAPKTVGGDFDCKSNQLTSLLGAPKTVDCVFFCERNPLKSLEGAPERVGSFNISIWSSGPAIRTLDWDKGWNKGDVEFTKTLISKLKEINALGSGADRGKLTSMLLSLMEESEILKYLLSQNLSTSDKFAIYGAIKANIPDVWYKLKDELDPEGATSDLIDLGF